MSDITPSINYPGYLALMDPQPKNKQTYIEHMQGYKNQWSETISQNQIEFQRTTNTTCSTLTRVNHQFILLLEI